MFYNVYREWCKDYNGGYAESKQEVQRILDGMKKGSKIKTNGGYFYYRTITLNRETKTAYENICGPVYEDYSDDEDPEAEEIEHSLNGDDVDVPDLNDLDNSLNDDSPLIDVDPSELEDLDTDKIEH